MNLATREMGRERSRTCGLEWAQRDRPGVGPALTQS